MNENRRGLAESLKALRAALAVRPGRQFRARAWGLTETSNRADNMRAFVNELHRVALYRPSSLGEIVPMPGEHPPTFDADDACLFVAALARVVGIPCRFVAARVGKHSWTCFLAYQDEEGFWVGIDVMRENANVIIEEIFVDSPVTTKWLVQFFGDVCGARSFDTREEADAWVVKKRKGPYFVADPVLCTVEMNEAAAKLELERKAGR